MEGGSPALLTLNPHEARTADAIFERIFPADENGPGATEIGAVAYVDRALSGVYREKVEDYRLGLMAVDSAAKERFGEAFADCEPGEQDAIISDLERGTLPNFGVPDQRTFFWTVREHARGPILRPGPRRKPRQAGMEGSRSSRRLAGTLGGGEPRHRTRYEGR